ncbi:hypothetical protein [Barrientosiimonas humi]|uniref:hypothetical protein n=1 Tax=Barrientosiimonas humi TaxID=999931 RepID=UPI00370D1486
MSTSETTTTEPSTDLVDHIDRLHALVERVQAGEPLALTPDALSRLVTDTARIYAGACQASGGKVPVATEGLTATNAVALITALMDAENLNTFDLTLWQSQTGEGAA